MSSRTALAFLATLAIPLPLAAQTTWFVDASAVPPGNGSPGSPYASLAFALAQPATVDGDTLAVAPGTYAENVDFLGKAVTVAGQASGVVIDGQWLGPCVRFTSGEGPASVLRDVQLAKGGGAPVGGITLSGGGGVLCIGSSPTLEGVVIAGNGNSSLCVPHHGGGMFLLDASPTLTDCSVSSNFACEEAGGVIVFGASSPTFTDCDISFNTPAAFPGAPQGAGVSSYATAPAIPTFEGCTFTGNQGGRGAALSGRAQAFDCLFQGNMGTVTGGAVFGVTLLQGCTLAGNEVFCDGSGADPEGAGAADSSTLVDCVVIDNRGFNGGGVRGCAVTSSLIAGNRATYVGGCAFGLALGGGAMDSLLINCIVEGNSVDEGFGGANQGVGGGAYGGDLAGCLILANLADAGGGAFAAQLNLCTLNANEARFGSDGVDGSLVSNSILWGNGALEVGGASSVEWSCVEGGFPGTGNIALDPEWWLATGGDWLLTAVSPCVDAGNPAQSDPDGSRVDMGWRPLDPSYAGEPSSYCNATVSALGCQAQIGWSGTPSLSGADDFHVTASSVEAQRVGLLVFARAPGAIAAPGGTLCLTAPFVRLPGQVSGGALDTCTGSFDQPLTQAFLAQQGLAPYGHGFAQYWYRSPGASGNAALSRALEFTLLP